MALDGAPPGPLEEDVLDEPARIVVEGSARVFLAPARHQAGTRAIPGHAEHQPLDGLPAPAHVADGGPELVGTADVVGLVELPELVAEDVAEDEEAPVAD